MLADGLGHQEGTVEVDIDQPGKSLGIVRLGRHVGAVKDAS